MKNIFKRPTQKKKAIKHKVMTASFLTCFLFELASASASVPEVVTDPGAYAHFVDMFKQAQESLAKFESMRGDLNVINNVLGGKLDKNFLGILQDASGDASQFQSTLSAFTPSGADTPLSAVNNLSRKYTKQDFSNYIYARNHFKDRFFPDKKDAMTKDKLNDIIEQKEAAVETSTIDSLALSTQQKRTLQADDQALKDIMTQGKVDTSVAYQLGVQNRILAHISGQINRLIALQAQTLELQAARDAHGQSAFLK